MKKAAIFVVLLLPALVIGAFWLAGNSLTAPVQTAVGSCPADLNCEDVEFSSGSGAAIRGWLVKGRPGSGVIVIMHGLRSNRLAQLDRMRFLQRDGYSVLAFDFRGSGESTGDTLTFGYLESRDATAALRFVREKLPAEKVGVMGISMGGAAFLLQKEEARNADALVLEMVYPTIRQAVKNRLNLWLFNGAEYLSPLITWQFPARIGVSVEDLQPLDRINDFKCPKFVIAGENDHHTTLAESRQLFEKSDQPKDLWIVPGAEHGDLYKIAPHEYEQRVKAFFARSLRGEK